MNNIIAVRGATTVLHDTEQEITQKTVELIKALIDSNGIGSKATCISVIISTTKDIKSFYPARAIRESGLLDAPLFSCTEPDINGSLALCIRVMLTLCSENGAEARHVYLGGARALRPDLAD